VEISTLSDQVHQLKSNHGGQPPAGPGDDHCIGEQSPADVFAIIAFALALLRIPFATERCLVYVSGGPERMCSLLLRLLVEGFAGATYRAAEAIHVYSGMSPSAIVTRIIKTALADDGRNRVVIFVEGVDRIGGTKRKAIDRICQTISRNRASLVLIDTASGCQRVICRRFEQNHSCDVGYTGAVEFGTFHVEDGPALAKVICVEHFGGATVPESVLQPLLHWARGSIYRLQTLAAAAAEHYKDVGGARFSPVTLSAHLARISHALYGTPFRDFTSALTQDREIDWMFLVDHPLDRASSDSSSSSPFVEQDDLSAFDVSDGLAACSEQAELCDD
jgi:hypothetical protein